MAYDLELARRIEALLTTQVDARKMFGGVGYLLNGNMAAGVHKNALIVRVGPENYLEALANDHVRPFDITGREMKGWVMVLPEGCADDQHLADWLERGIRFASQLPPK